MKQDIITKELVKKTADFVEMYFQENLPESLVYHTIAHTKYVVEQATMLAEKAGLTKDEIYLIQICAWFHDIGYCISFENHEAESIKIAQDFLKKQGVNPTLIKKVEACILATKMPQQPQDIVSRIVCDADLAHLASADYFETAKKIRKERKNSFKKKISKRKFLKETLQFFKEHNYHTDTAKSLFESKKHQNQQEIENQLTMLEQEKNTKDKKKKKGNTYPRGVESMFRNTARMQINLSSIADKKSNILISVNAIIISITTTLLVAQFEESPNIVIPSVVLLGFSLITIILAILSTRPNVSSGKFKRQDVQNNKANLLFFGNFYNMDFEEYEWAINEIMNDDKKLYSMIILDQYSLGKVLAKKYKLLRIAYNVFMVGIIVSVFVFVLAIKNV